MCTPPNGKTLPLICFSLSLTSLSILFPTMETSSIMTTARCLYLVLRVFKMSLLNGVQLYPWLAGILNAEWRVTPLMWKAAFPVGAHRRTLQFSGSSPGSEVKQRCNASNNAVTSTDFPTPAPPDKNTCNLSLLILTVWRTCVKNSLCLTFKDFISSLYFKSGKVFLRVLMSTEATESPRSCAISDCLWVSGLSGLKYMKHSLSLLPASTSSWLICSVPGAKLSKLFSSFWAISKASSSASAFFSYSLAFISMKCLRDIYFAWNEPNPHIKSDSSFLHGVNNISLSL